MADISLPEFVAQFWYAPDAGPLKAARDRILERFVSQLNVPNRVLQGETAVPREPSSEEKGFIRAFWCADCGDPLPRLVYADWLDEHGFAEEAERARADLPPLDCDCRGAGVASYDGRGTYQYRTRLLTCYHCGSGYRLAETQTAIGREWCVRCGGKGEIRCGSICPTCNGRWVPPRITKAEPGDLLWAWDSFVRMQTRPQFQGDRPWFAASVVLDRSGEFWRYFT